MARLRSRIYANSLLVLVVACLATGAVFAFGARGAFMGEVAERLARHLAALVAEDIRDPNRLQRRLDQLHAQLDIDLTVRDLDGRLLGSTGGELPAPSPTQTDRLLAGKPAIRARPAWSAAIVVADPQSGTPVGILQARVRHHFVGFPLLHPALAVLVVLLSVAFVTRPLARRISRPLERLTEAARRLGGGDLSYRVPTDDTDREQRPWRRRLHRTDELQALTRAFNEMAERVERLVRNQKELLTNVSHELRSPLTRIRMALELLPRDGVTDARVRGVENDLADLDRLIEDILTTARLDATGLPTRLDAFDAQRLLAEIAERARLDPVLAAATVRVLDGPPLPVVADAALLRRAVWNLVENAAKYGASPITLAASRAGDRAEFSVTDEGPGIAASERERVFTPFYRGDPAHSPAAAADGARGFGLGLTLARQVAEVHGGTITIRPSSAVDGHERGCRVVISIPSGAAA